ncbi:MAG: sulfatase, partial [Acidobacteriota bacterium]
MVALLVASGLASCAEPASEARRWRDLAPPAVERFDIDSVVEVQEVRSWTFAETESWRIGGLDRDAGAESKGLSGVATRAHLTLRLRDLELAASRVDRLVLQLASAEPQRSATLHWASDGQTFGRPRDLRQSSDRDGTIVFDLRDVESWRGSIKKLRLVLPATVGDPFEIVDLRALSLQPRAERLERLAMPRRVDIGRDERDAVILAPGDQETFAFRPGVAGRLRFAISSLAAAGASRPSVTLTLSDADGRTRWREEIEAEPGWRPLEIDLATDLDQPPQAARRLWSLQVRTSSASERSALADWIAIETPGLSELTAPSAVRTAPDVLLISIDTLRADRLSLYGHTVPTTPHLDRWAAGRAVTFETVVAPAPWTLPSHASMFTGLDVDQHRVQWREPAPTSLDTLAEALRAAGYRTIASTGGAYLHPRFGLGQGFQRLRYRAGLRDLDLPTLERQVEELLADLDAAPGPTFAFLHTYAVHGPRAAVPQAYGRLFEGPTPAAIWKSSPLARTPDEGMAIRRHYELRGDGRPLEPSDLDELKAIYDSRVAAVDTALGGLFDALEARGRLDEMLVIVTSDHGEALGESFAGVFGLANHTHLEPAVLDVPLVVQLPRAHDPAPAARGRRVARQVRTVDLAPTILEIAGAASSGQLDGSSLLPLVADRAAAHPRAAWSAAPYHATGVRLQIDGRGSVTFRPTLVHPAHGRSSLVASTDPSVEVEPLGEQLVGEIVERLEARSRGVAVSLGLVRAAGPRRLALRGVDVERLKTWRSPQAVVAWSEVEGCPILSVEPGEEVEMFLLDVRTGVLTIEDLSTGT